MRDIPHEPVPHVRVCREHLVEAVERGDRVFCPEGHELVERTVERVGDYEEVETDWMTAPAGRYPRRALLLPASAELLGRLHGREDTSMAREGDGSGPGRLKDGNVRTERFGAANGARLWISLVKKGEAFRVLLKVQPVGEGVRTLGSVGQRLASYREAETQYAAAKETVLARGWAPEPLTGPKGKSIELQDIPAPDAVAGKAGSGRGRAVRKRASAAARRGGRRKRS